MRILIRHAIALLFVVFACKLAIQSQNSHDNSGVPKALLLGSLPARHALPSKPIDPRPIIARIQRE